MTGNPNIAVWVADRALSDPHLPAIKQGDTILSYAALDGAASRFATLLAVRQASSALPRSLRAGAGHRSAVPAGGSPEAR